MVTSVWVVIHAEPSLSKNNLSPCKYIKNNLDIFYIYTEKKCANFKLKIANCFQIEL